jgi:hypothetical protein
MTDFRGIAAVFFALGLAAAGAHATGESQCSFGWSPPVYTRTTPRRRWICSRRCRRFQPALVGGKLSSGSTRPFSTSQSRLSFER